MVVNSMNDNEIVNEILTDWYENAIPYFARKMIAQNSKYRRIVMKSHRNNYHFFNKIEYTSPRNNRFVIVPYSINWSDFKKRGSLYLSYATVTYKRHRLYLHILHDADNQLTFYANIFCWHCLQRFCQRFIKKNTEINDELFIEIIKRNSVYWMTDEDTPKGKRPHYISDDGIFLGDKIDDNNYIFKTYISEDEMGENQRKLYRKWVENFLDYKNDNYLLDYSRIAS